VCVGNMIALARKFGRCSRDAFLILKFGKCNGILIIATIKTATQALPL
jgi:hypothetical protein